MEKKYEFRKLCQQTVQEFWLGRKDVRDVLDVYEIRKEDECHDSLVKFLLKTKRDFINGFSFFTRESIDAKIMHMTEKTHRRNGMR